MEETRRRRPRSLIAKLGWTALVLAVLSGMIAGSMAAFSSITSNGGSSFSAGTVNLTDNDSDVAMLSLANAKPGDSDESCIRVSFAGSLPSTVRAYGTTSGTGLDQYLTVVVTRGSIASPAFDTCTGFTADATDYIGNGNGVIYSGTLAGFADDYTAGLVDPKASSPETWANGETHDYRFVVTLADNNSAKGLNASQTFTWEARPV